MEAYVLMLMAGTGAMLMAESGGLIMLFLGLEIMRPSRSTSWPPTTAGGSAVWAKLTGLKYFVLGASSSAIFLYGIALVYGAGRVHPVPGDGQLPRRQQPQQQRRSPARRHGSARSVGLGFKVAAVLLPFLDAGCVPGIADLRSPGIWPRSCWPVSPACFRSWNQGLISQQANWRPAIWVMAVLTLLVGLGAGPGPAQVPGNGCSPIPPSARPGTSWVGVEAASGTGTSAALFYLFTYTFIIIGTFAVVSIIQGRGEARTDLGAMRGLAKARPLAGRGDVGVPAGPGRRAVHQRLPGQALRSSKRRCREVSTRSPSSPCWLRPSPLSSAFAGGPAHVRSAPAADFTGAGGEPVPAGAGVCRGGCGGCGRGAGAAEAAAGPPVRPTPARLAGAGGRVEWR